MQSASRFDEVFLFSSHGLPETTFHVARFTGSEGLNELFLFRILLVCNDTAVDSLKLLHAPARFTIRRKNGEDAVFTGYPTVVEQGGFFNGYAYYTVELRPTLWKLTRIVKNAIFLEQDVQAVADDLLNSEKFLSIPREFRFTRSDYPRPEFAMQYEETLYDYMQWRLEEQGAYFYFAPDGDTVIFADSPSSHDTSAGTVFYSPTTGLEVGHISEVVTSFTMSRHQLPARVIVRGYDWKDPNRILAAMAPVSPAGLGDVVLTNEAVASEADAQRLATTRAEELLAQECIFTGTGSVPYLRPGVVFTLARHYSEPFNRDYMVTKITHEGSQEAMLGMLLDIPMENAPDHLSYRNTFTCIASDTTFRPARTAPRAKIAGVVHAFIDSENDGSRPFLDEYGRYKLLFPFDVSDRSGGKRSCWIRRAQEQVGNDCGMSFPLMPGTEVLVGFVDGNPDRPVITGALANGETGALTGSGNANASGIRTPGGNQITINDTDTHQGMSFLTASGNGITMSSGSVDFCKNTVDLGLDAAAVGSSGMAALFKNQFSGAFSSSAVGTMKADKAKWLAAQAVLKGASGVMDSLSTNAPNSGELAWGAGVTKMGLLALEAAKAIRLKYKTLTDSHPFGYEVMSSKGKVVALQQCNQTKSELVTLFLLWFATRAGSISTGIASPAKKGESKTKAELAKEEKKFKKDLEIYKGITDTDKQNEEWKKYKENQKKTAVRKAIVSQVSDLLPELTAIITTTMWAHHLGDKTLGGIKLNATEQNIHLQAKTYIGQHAEKGIVLNTIQIDDRQTWGSPDHDNLQEKFISIGKKIHKNIANNLSFIRMETDLNHQYAKQHHIINAGQSVDIVSPTSSFRSKNAIFGFKEADSTYSLDMNNEGKINIQAKTSVTCKSAQDAQTIHTLCLNNEKISLNAGTSIQTIFRDSILFSSNGKSSIGLKDNEAAVTDGRAYLTMRDGTAELAGSKVSVGKLVVQGGNIKGNEAGVVTFCNAIKVIQCSSSVDLSSGINELNKMIKDEKAWAAKQARGSY